MNKTILTHEYKSTLLKDTTSHNRREKIIRLTNKDRKFMDRDNIVDFIENLKKFKRPNQNIMIIVMTEYGPRNIKKLYQDNINWMDEEEYLSNTARPQPKPYRQIFWVDIYITTQLDA